MDRKSQNLIHDEAIRKRELANAESRDVPRDRKAAEKQPPPLHPSTTPLRGRREETKERRDADYKRQRKAKQEDSEWKSYPCYGQDAKGYSTGKGKGEAYYYAPAPK